MACKNNVSIKVCGRTMTLSGTESVEYITEVANYIEQKAEELRENDSSRSLNPSLISVLTSINITDDLFKEIEKREKLEKEILVLKEGAFKNVENASFSAVDTEKEKLKETAAEMESKLKNAEKTIGDLEELLEKTTAEKADAIKIVQALQSKVLILEEDVRGKIAKINHLKSNQDKENPNLGFEKKFDATKKVDEVKEAEEIEETKQADEVKNEDDIKKKEEIKEVKTKEENTNTINKKSINTFRNYYRHT